jgi:hypothetical protein
MKACFLLPALVVLHCSAADKAVPFDVKTGLWQTVFVNQFDGIAAPPLPSSQLAQMPPDQRKRILEYEKAHGGPGAPRGLNGQACLTNESLSRALNLSPNSNGNSCAPTLVSSTSGKQVLRVNCTNSGGKTAGDITIERVDAQHIRGAGQIGGEMTTTDGKTRPFHMKMSLNATWVSPKCGSVKPLEEK